MSIALDLKRHVQPSRVSVWLAVDVALYALLGLVSLLVVAAVNGFVLAALEIPAEIGTPSWGVYLGMHELVWGAGAAWAALLVGRRVVAGLQPHARPALPILGAGLVAAAATMFAVHEFVRARFGYFDGDATGWIILAPPALVALALAAWAAEVVPAHLRGSLTPLLLAAGGLFAGAVLPGLPGLRDGLSPSGVLVAAILLVDVAFTAFVVLRHTVRQASGT